MPEYTRTIKNSPKTGGVTLEEARKAAKHATYVLSRDNAGKTSATKEVTGKKAAGGVSKKYDKTTVTSKSGGSSKPKTSTTAAKSKQK